MTPRPPARRAGPRAGALLALGIAAAVALWAAIVPNAAVATSSVQRLGDVAIVSPNGTTVLRDGASASQFTLRLTGDVTCPGDSEHDQWRVQSFFVPAAADPATLHYGVVGPDGKDEYSLFDERTASYTDVLLESNDSPGEAGRLAALPSFSFGVFPPGTLPMGQYRLGIACTHFRDTATYWDTTITLTASPSDQPSGFVWHADAAPVVPPGSDGGSGPSAALIAGAVALVLLAAGVALVLLRPRRDSSPTRRAA